MSSLLLPLQTLASLLASDHFQSPAVTTNSNLTLMTPSYILCFICPNSAACTEALPRTLLVPLPKKEQKEGGGGTELQACRCSFQVSSCALAPTKVTAASVIELAPDAPPYLPPTHPSLECGQVEEEEDRGMLNREQKQKSVLKGE